MLDSEQQTNTPFVKEKSPYNSSAQNKTPTEYSWDAPAVLSLGTLSSARKAIEIKGAKNVKATNLN